MMRYSLLCGATAVALALSATSARAQALLYGMETGTAANPDGFGPNGGGVSVSQNSTIGVTQGSDSMKVSVVGGATFVGALTGNVAPALAPPISPEEVDFDYTIA